MARDPAERLEDEMTEQLDHEISAEPPEEPKKDFFSGVKGKIGEIKTEMKKDAEIRKEREAELNRIRKEAQEAGKKVAEERRKKELYEKEFTKESQKLTLTERLGQLQDKMRQQAASRAAAQGRAPPRPIPFSRPTPHLKEIGYRSSFSASSPTITPILGGATSKGIPLFASKKSRSNTQFSMFGPSSKKSFSLYGGKKQKKWKVL